MLCDVELSMQRWRLLSAGQCRGCKRWRRYCSTLWWEASARENRGMQRRGQVRGAEARSAGAEGAGCAQRRALASIVARAGGWLDERGTNRPVTPIAPTCRVWLGGREPRQGGGGRARARGGGRRRRCSRTAGWWPSGGEAVGAAHHGHPPRSSILARFYRAGHLAAWTCVLAAPQLCGSAAGRRCCAAALPPGGRGRKGVSLRPDRPSPFVSRSPGGILPRAETALERNTSRPAFPRPRAFRARSAGRSADTAAGRTPRPGASSG